MLMAQENVTDRGRKIFRAFADYGQLFGYAGRCDRDEAMSLLRTCRELDEAEVLELTKDCPDGAKIGIWD